jgi:ABC transport system ATP-binding/permease protein
MALISCQSLRIAFGGPLLLDDASLQIERGERVGLLGRNGEGKSTLFKIIMGTVAPDAGEVVRDSGTRVSLVDQELPAGLTGSVLDLIASGTGHTPVEEHHAERLGSLLHLDPSQDWSSLSGGQKRRVLLGRALVTDPDVLLLDEPTNHLDLDHIDQLEAMLLRFGGSVFFITHDRAFLQRVATRIVELDRGRLRSWACDYQTYLTRKEALLSDEEQEWGRLDRELAKEEAWIRQGIKARRTRNEGRVRALEQLREERAARRDRVGSVRLNVSEGGRSTAKVMEATGVSFGYGSETVGGSPDTARGESGDGSSGETPPIIRDFTSSIGRGDKVGIIGPNGCGKTTLLNLLVGDLAPTAGTVKHGARLEIAYFDQLRDTLDPTATVADSVSGGNEYVTVGDERKHIFGYLQDFLFSAETARQPVSSLSGGERSRLLLARLFTRPANVLILDEPTNDLDTETLELLEARLVAYRGTVLLVSHDRAFLDNICTSTLVFEGGGRFKEYAGGYSDWKRTIARQAAVAGSGESGAGSSAGSGARSGTSKAERWRSGTGGAADKPRKLSWKERKQWTELPAQIEELEYELHRLQERMSAPAFFQGDVDEIRSATSRAKQIPDEIEAAFQLWGELDERA